MKLSLPFLQTLGLTESEILLYEILLNLGESPVSLLIQESKLKRPTVYKALYTLEKEGLVEKTDKQKKIHFTPTPPTKLLELAEKQLTTISQVREDVQSILPALTNSYLMSVEKPVIRIYEGIEGIKKANLEVLAEKQEILAYVYADEAIDKQMEPFWKKYYRQRIKDNIFVRSISPNNKAGVEYQRRDNEELRQTYLVPLEKFPINIEKNIVGNKVVFFSKEGGNLIATIIENKMIADTERVIFELAWKEAERFDKIVSSRR